MSSKSRSTVYSVELIGGRLGGQTFDALNVYRTRVWKATKSPVDGQMALGTHDICQFVRLDKTSGTVRLDGVEVGDFKVTLKPVTAPPAPDAPVSTAKAEKPDDTPAPEKAEDAPKARTPRKRAAKS